MEPREQPANSGAETTRPAPTCPSTGTPGGIAYADLEDVCHGVPGRWSLRCAEDEAVYWLDPQPAPGHVGRLYRTYATHVATRRKRATGAKRLKADVRANLLARRYGYTPKPTSVWAKLLSYAPFQDGAALRSVSWAHGPHRTGRLLDVGCGNGELMFVMQDAGWDVTGVEPDPAAAERAREAGLDVHTGVLEEARLASEGFDAILLSHVIEHLPDPDGTLRECRRLLAPGGQIVLTTPNVESLGHRRFGPAWRGLEVPRHLILYSAASLRAALEGAGFDVTRVTTIARTARWIYCVGRQIEDGATPLSDVGEHTTKWRKLQGRLFQTKESWLARFRPCGEELLVCGQKPAS